MNASELIEALRDYDRTDMDFLMDEAANKIESLQQELDEAYEKIDKLRLDASYANYD